MERFVKGDVVIILFPFSDLTNSKKRPALVLSALSGDDIIVCQITSKSVKDDYSIEIDNSDFKTGKLNQCSNIRPNKIFTADKKIVCYKAGTLKKNKTEQIVDLLVKKIFL
ncbi:type II toxin-antitoxin system PemK/MazF family toxin [bacterium]|nr:type II toxin-antitoxin system PemK/MazF family toxin [bacterium]